MPVARSLLGSFSMISHMDVIKICIFLDKAVMPSAKAIKEIFIKNLDELLGEEWKNFDKNEARSK